VIPPDGPTDKIVEQRAEVKAVGGGLLATGDLEFTLAFYRDDYVLTIDPDGQLKRSDFLRGPDGKIAWLRDGGRLWARQS
jgi:ketosteroid isomerase-like protein